MGLKEKGTALRQAQGPAKAKVIEPVEIEDSTELNADRKRINK
jgi:hypothetical protein